MNEQNYVLVTSARNEAEFIEKTLCSVVAQTTTPLKWVIISDGSIDATDDIVRGYEARFGFIKFIRADNQKERDFASKVFALRLGFKELAGYPYRYIGILDADISLKPDYYERILNEFRKDPKLGIAGGLLFDCAPDNTLFKRFSSTWSVPGGIQMFRRECFEKIEGLLPLRYGEEDLVAEVKARMAVHHRFTGSAGRNVMQAVFNNGLRDYYTGTEPIFEIIKCVKRLRQKPYLFHGIFRYFGYVWASLRRYKRDIPSDVIAHLQSEQKQRLIAMIKNPFSKKNNYVF
jgi:poly-beta-1,6-N-acetyl-D-glucosamine synthase